MPSLSTNHYKKDSCTQQGTKQNVPHSETSQVPNTEEQSKPLMIQPKESSVNKLIKTNYIEPMDKTEPELMVEHLKPTIISVEQKSSPKSTSNVDVNKNLANVENMNKTKKVNSWASNYLNSIGHNKPIKMNLSLIRNKKQRVETISTNKPVAQPPLYKDTEPSSHEVFDTADSYREFNKLNNNTDENMNIGRLKTLHSPVKSDVHLKVAPVVSKSNLPAPANSTILVDTIYSSDSNIKAPAYATLLAKTDDEATYCYNDGHREIDIFDAIKSKINRKNAIAPKSRTMNLPTHKDMCEDFIKEISIKSTAFEKKSDRSKSSPPAKSKETRLVKKKSSTPKPESKVIKNKIKELSKTIKKIDKELLKKSKTSFTEKDAQKKNDQDCQRYKKQQNSKPIIDLKDFDNLSKHIFKTNRQPAMQVHSPERPNLKRARTCSEDRQSPSSKIFNTSPMRSVVQVADNNYQSISPKRKCFEESFDLRSKLSRVNERINRKKKAEDLNKNPTQRENLKITVENHTDEKHKSPKKPGVLKYKTNKCKKLKLIINVVCQDSDDETTSSDSSNSETENNTHHMDLSFLDDFNVDEIVDSLKHSPKHKIKSPLSHEIKLGNSNKMLVEPELKLATILGMLNVKSETNNNFTSSLITECKSQETGSFYEDKINRAALSNMNKLNSVPEISGILKKEKTNEDNIIKTENTTHDLVKILCQTKKQLHQHKAAVSEERNISVNISHEQQSEDNEKLVIDESVIINEQEISIIDLTNDSSNENTYGATETNNITAVVTATPINIHQKKLINDNKKDDIAVEWNQHQTAGNKIVNQLEPITRHIHYQNETGQLETKAYKIETTILNQDHGSVIDLTDDTVDDETISQNMAKVSVLVDKEPKNNAEDVSENIKHTINAETGKQKDMNTQINIESKIFINKDVHLIPLPEKRKKENEKPVVTKIQPIDGEKRNNKNYLNTATQLETKQPMEIGNNVNSMNNGLINSNNQIKSDIAGVVKPANQDNMKTEKLTKQVPHTFDNKVTSNVIEKVVEIVWDTKTELENTSKTNDTNNEDGKIFQANDTKTEIGIASKSNIIKNKSTNKANFERNISDNETKELITTNLETEKIPKPANQIITNKECMINVSATSNTAITDSAPNDNKNMKKIFESKTAKEVLDKIVATVWETKNELEDTSKTTDTKKEIGKSQTKDTKTEMENASKNSIIENKVKNHCSIGYQYRALSELLEQRMQDYLIKNIKIIKHIRHGKYSNIFSCKDSKGQMYAAKILKSDTNRQALGIEKEEMIKRLQQDIPRENLNTVFLIDGFGIERYWCFLTEYYPKNLQQVLAKCKPFHLNRVQHLARQLISAVMLLRNNNIVHSDIRPSHILIDSNQERLKLCGFDSAYYRNNVVLLPNIGTGCYRAPEIILGLSAGHSIDVWSSALVIYEMATKSKLIDGIYNNDVLFKQMCTFGSLPRDMVETSNYKALHFQGRIFKRRVGVKGQDVRMYANFYQTKRLQKSLWIAFNNMPGGCNVEKLADMCSLLEQMLLLDPRHRLKIEFACVDPFIYGMW